jgi:hypothetical protein
MTFKQMIRKLSTNSVAFARTGEMEKAAACLAMIDFIQTNGLDNLKGEVMVAAEASAENEPDVLAA